MDYLHNILDRWIYKGYVLGHIQSNKVTSCICYRVFLMCYKFYIDCMVFCFAFLCPSIQTLRAIYIFFIILSKITNTPKTPSLWTYILNGLLFSTLLGGQIKYTYCINKLEQYNLTIDKLSHLDSNCLSSSNITGMNILIFFSFCVSQ